MYIETKFHTLELSPLLTDWVKKRPINRAHFILLRKRNAAVAFAAVGTVSLMAAVKLERLGGEILNISQNEHDSEKCRRLCMKSI